MNKMTVYFCYFETPDLKVKQYKGYGDSNETDVHMFKKTKILRKVTKVQSSLKVKIEKTNCNVSIANKKKYLNK